MSRLNAITQIVVVEQTSYRGRTQYGGMGIDQLKELKRVQIVCAQHSDIITALQKRDPAQAAQMMRIHMQTSLSHRLKAYRDQH